MKNSFTIRIKTSAAGLIIALVLVISFSFMQRPDHITDYLYSPHSGQTYIPCSAQGSSIMASELNTCISINWTAGSGTRHQNGDYLLGIEFDAARYSLQDATNIIYNYYTAGPTACTLPNDGQNSSGIIVFRSAVKK